MADLFSGGEVFQIAMEIEETGRVFYEALAISSRNDRVSDLCRRLAGQEQQHYHTFDQMRQDRLRRGPARPMGDDELAYVQALINEQVIPSAEGVRRIAAKGTLAEALDLAVKMENDSVQFYTKMLPAVDAADAEAVRGIIDEEQRHARDLAAARGELH